MVPFTCYAGRDKCSPLSSASLLMVATPETKMALVVWRTGAWRLQIVKRSDIAGFEVLPTQGLALTCEKPRPAIDRIVRDRDADLLMEPHDQIAGPPAHDAIDAGIGLSSTRRARNALCSFVTLPGAPGDTLLMRPSGPCSLNRIIAASADPCRRSLRLLAVRRRRGAVMHVMLQDLAGPFCK